MEKNCIKIKDIVNMAITEEQGLKLRKKIGEIIESQDEIVLDFEDIKLFTTMFFNASIGYYILQYSPEKCKNIFNLKNISKVGEQTYKHSFENAEEIFKDENKLAIIRNVTEQVINES